MELDDTLTMSELGAHLPYLMASPSSISHASVPQPEDKVTATFKPFQYTRLQDNQIRVLRISIDPDTKFLICSFDVRDLTACWGTYRAISYCWGDPKPTYSLLCSTGDHLNLTESAAEVLKFVLIRTPEDWFWIDQVVAWLGRGNKNTQRAVAFVEQMSIFLNELKRKGVQPTLESFFKTSARLHNIPGQLYGSRKWRTLTDLLANPWFERVWVVQEVVMAPDRSGCPEDPIVLAFENCTISFEMFATVVQKIWDDHLHTELAYNPKSKDTTDQLRQYPPGFNAVRIYLIFRTIRREKTEPLSMSWALIYTKNFKAADYRDKIYAIMDFADPANLGLQPDYECPLEEVYIAYATKLIEQNDYPILLHIAGIGHQNAISTLPSWVPNFSPSPFSVNIKSHINKKWFEASANPPINTVRLDPCSNTMSFMGVEIDTVELLFRRPTLDDTGERYSSQESSSRWNPFLRTAQKILFPEREYHECFINFLNDVEAFLNNSNANPNWEGSTSKETLFYTLIRDYPIGEATVDRDLLEAYNAWYSAYRELAGHHILKSFFASATRKPETYGQVQRFEDLVGASDGPIFGTTTRGLLGSRLEGMLPGDMVCIILGARTPFLLRPDTKCIGDQSSRRWKLVGPCFVYGLMYGEGLSMGEPKEFVVT